MWSQGGKLFAFFAIFYISAGKPERSLAPVCLNHCFNRGVLTACFVCFWYRHLLAVGLCGLEGVVYLDDQDKKMIVTRAGGMRPLLLADCHVPPDLRFTFYDQVHTTGKYSAIRAFVGYERPIFVWVGKHVRVIHRTNVKPTKVASQGPTQPLTKRVKMTLLDWSWLDDGRWFHVVTLGFPTRQDWFLADAVIVGL